MSDSSTSLTDSVRKATLDGAKGQSDITDVAAQALYGHLFGALGGDADSSACTADACAGLVLAAKKTAHPLWHLARGGAIGVAHAAAGRQLDVLSMLGAAVRRMMTEADGLGADFGAVAQGTVQGAILAARELGLSSRETGTAVAVAALETAGELGPAALAKVRRIVDRSVLGQALDIPAALLG